MWAYAHACSPGEHLLEHCTWHKQVEFAWLLLAARVTSGPVKLQRLNQKPGAACMTSAKIIPSRIIFLCLLCYYTIENDFFNIFNLRIIG